jgi:hypothetical protein
MSWFSKNIIDPLVAAFEKAAQVGGGPSAQPAQHAIGSLTQAKSDVQAALEGLAVVGANYALSLLPNGGAYAPLVDEFIDAVIARLAAAKTAAAKS